MEIAVDSEEGEIKTVRNHSVNSALSGKISHSDVLDHCCK